MYSENDRTGSLNGLNNSAIGMKSLSQSSGMTNGLGGTSGLMNGLGGKTNGLGGKNGMTNGLGGKTNGLGGRTNGMTNGLGGTSGLTNGLGGKTNGLGGRTNGMTNGLGSGGPVMRSRRMDDSGISPFRISLIIVIAFMIIVPVSFFMVAQNEAKIEGLHVDGDFSDWADVSMNSDTEPYSVASLDIARFAVSMNDAGNLYLYAETVDSWMPTPNADSLFVFIDSDANPGTGYIVQGMGAEYVADVYGWQGSVQGSQIGIFSGADQYNWSAWNWRSAEAAMNGTQIEIGIRGPVFTTYEIQPTHSILFLTMRDGVPADICDGKIGIDLPSLTVQMVPQDPNGVLTTDIPMTLVLTAGTSAVEVTAIGIDCSGVSSATVAGIPASIPAGGVTTLEVTAPVTSLANGTFVGMAVTSVTCAGICTSIIGQPLAAYANSAPNGISIDGAFGDWTDISKIADSDNISNPNTDIDRHASVNSSIEAFFYLRVSENGEMLGGSMAPIERSVPETPSEPSPANGTSAPVSVVTPRVTGEDFTRIYIDTEPTGQSINGILADYLIEVTGKGGAITSQKLFSLPEKTFIQDIAAGVSGREMETGVPLTVVNYSGSLQYFIETTDWLQNADRTDAGYSMPFVYSTRSGTDFQTPCSELTVGAGQAYTTIQSAIDAATPGDTIRVWEGTYSENVIVNKTLTITGNGSASVTIDGGGAGDTVTIVSDSVDFSGFTVTNVNSYDIYLSGVSDCRIHNNTAVGNTLGGITLESSGGNTVEYNTCPSSMWAGIVLLTSDGNTVRNNVVTGNQQGIYLDTSVSNAVIMNNVTLSTLDGIVLDPDSNMNNISFNEVSGCANTGILLNFAYGNMVTQNTVADNGNGVFIETSSGNEVFHNNFIANSIQGYDNNTGSNFWDNGVEGNYWSDYSGVDADSNGIGDTPHAVEGGVNQDNYPVMKIGGWLPIYNSDTDTYYSTIQEALDGAFAGNTVIISDGLFTENLVIDKPLTLVGDGMFNTTELDAQGGIGIHITSDNATVSDMIIFNGTEGIFIDTVTNTSVNRVNSSFNSDYGVHLLASDNSSITDSIVSENTLGLYIDSSSDITLSNISVHNNTWEGLYIENSQRNTVSDSSFNDNNYGISISAGGNHTLCNSTCSNNDWGVYIDSSSSNLVYGNNFLGNTAHAFDNTGTNMWNATYPLGGNYWGGYTGYDNYSGANQDIAGEDGFIDTPYTAISGGMGAQDEYPLIPIPEFRLILLPIIILLGLVVMARKGRGEQSDSEEPETDEITDEGEAETTEADSDPEDEVSEKKAAGKPEIKRSMLIAGVAFSSLGALGIIGLRAGMVQPILGYDNPAPGIGGLEIMGLMASAIPLAIGLVTVLVWGARNNPAYFELEKIKEAESKEEVGETETKPAEEGPDSAAEEEAEIFPEEEPELAEEVIPESEETEKEIPEVAEAPRMIPKAAPEPVPVSPAPKAVAEPKAKPKDEQAEKMRIERSQKMISYAAVTPEDRERLTGLMESGMPVQKFTEEVKKAVEKRRKMETEAAERKKAEEASRKKKEDEENGRNKPVETDEDAFIDDAELEDLLLDEVDK